uniref:Cytochrome c oxidase subunit 3 n=1 Tax=Nomia chalybeata TaxID=2448184 RepID=A0A7L8EZP7_9HYME|nr:cytochrome c oxidase subunit III [Nomia chalybeata]QOE17504.1 cytochrome c oxidase subunit 3 [Nomia chalybeata]
MMNKMKNHPFHMTTNSPWPLIMSFNVMNLLFINVISLNSNFSLLNLFNLLTILMTSYQWWRDLIRESTFQGFHTLNIMNMIKFSMILFIISELFFFISFFWTFLHSSISPSMEIGNMWPPKMIKMFNPYDIPLLNSIILISSGMTITWSHNLIKNNKKKSFMLLNITIILGIYFSMLQYIEYLEAQFSFNDSIFGSIFFMATGFHGIHVIIGTTFLLICSIRMNMNHFSMIHHLNFDLASWYWHFVDMIWLILYILIYWWMF